MNVRCASFAAVLAFAALALAPVAAEAQARMPTHVACVGDSITYGYLASSASKSYPSDLQGLFGNGVQVKNFGHSGATMLSDGDTPYVNQSEYTAATTFVSGAGASAVVDVIIMLGTNDSKAYNWAPTAGTTRATELMTDCAAMVDHFAGLSTHPVVYLALPPAIYTNTFGIDETVTSTQIDPLIQQVAMQKGIPLIDIHTPTLNHPEEFQDGVHPTDAGYLILAQLMQPGLLRVPAVSITMPTANASIAGPTVAIGADASGGTVPITSVQFFRATTSIATVTQSPFMTTWTNAAPGAYTLTAKATDKTGAAATSDPISITVGGTGGAGTGGGGGGAVGGGGGAGGAGGSAGSGGSSGGAAAGQGGGTGGAAGAGGPGTGGRGSGTGGASGTGGTTSSGGAPGTGGRTTSGTGGTTGAGGASSEGAGTSSGGCGCSQSGGGPSSGLAALGLLVLAIERRRRGP